MSRRGIIKSDMAKQTAKTTGDIKQRSKLQRVFPWILIVCSVLALISSFSIMTEKLASLENPNHTSVCDINPVISCGTVSSTDQAHAFGFPNQYIGFVGFTIFGTVGAALLAGAQFRRWFWVGLQLGALAAVGFIHWLIYQSVYTIGSLCLFCMLLWVAVIPLFWYVTLYNLREGHIRLPKGAGWQKFGNFIQRHHLDILIAWYLIIAVLVLQHFWYYFGTLV